MASRTLWNKEIRRCGVVDIAEKGREAWLRWCGHVPGQRHYGMKRSENNAKW